MFLKQTNTKDKLYTLDDKSPTFESTVNVEQTVQMLDSPDVVTKGDRFYYKFVNSNT